MININEYLLSKTKIGLNLNEDIIKKSTYDSFEKILDKLGYIKTLPKVTPQWGSLSVAETFELFKSCNDDKLYATETYKPIGIKVIFFINKDFANTVIEVKFNYKTNDIVLKEIEKHVDESPIITYHIKPDELIKYLDN